MARASARSKTAASGSSPTSEAPGITTQEISELRDMFSTTRSWTPTQQFQIQPWSQPSPPPSKRLELVPSSSGESARQARLTVEMPDGVTLIIQTEELTIEFERDFVDANTFSGQQRVYRVDAGTFTIKGKL